MKRLAEKVAALRDETAPAREAAESGVTSEPAVFANSFLREGEYWAIGYGGKVIRLKDTKGLRDLAFLLANPGKEIHVADLIAAAGSTLPAPGSAAYQRMSAEQLEEMGLSTSSSGVSLEALDSQARSEYRARLADLHEQLEEAERANDIGRATKAREELDFIAGQLASAYGLGGRARRSGDPAERRGRPSAFGSARP